MTQYIKETINLDNNLTYFLGQRYHSVGNRRYEVLAGVEG